MICHIYTCIDMANFKSSTATSFKNHQIWHQAELITPWLNTEPEPQIHLRLGWFSRTTSHFFLAQFDYFHPIFDGAEAQVCSSLASDG